MVKEQIRLELEDKLKRLEEDRNSSSGDSFFTDCLQSLKKKKRYSAQIDNCFFRDIPDRRKKPVTVAGPFVVYLLPDSDIIEDYNLIKTAIKNPSPEYY